MNLKFGGLGKQKKYIQMLSGKKPPPKREGFPPKKKLRFLSQIRIYTWQAEGFKKLGKLGIVDTKSWGFQTSNWVLWEGKW